MHNCMSTMRREDYPEDLLDLSPACWRPAGRGCQQNQSHQKPYNLAQLSCRHQMLDACSLCQSPCRSSAVSHTITPVGLAGCQLITWHLVQAAAQNVTDTCPLDCNNFICVCKCTKNCRRVLQHVGVGIVFSPTWAHIEWQTEPPQQTHTLSWQARSNHSQIGIAKA